MSEAGKYAFLLTSVVISHSNHDIFRLRKSSTLRYGLRSEGLRRSFLGREDQDTFLNKEELINSAVCVSIASIPADMNEESRVIPLPELNASVLDTGLIAIHTGIPTWSKPVMSAIRDIPNFE